MVPVSKNSGQAMCRVEFFFVPDVLSVRQAVHQHLLADGLLCLSLADHHAHAGHLFLSLALFHLQGMSSVHAVQGLLGLLVFLPELEG